MQPNNEKAMFEKLRSYLERSFPFSDEEFENFKFQIPNSQSPDA
jgi:hypothetical protein